MDTWLQRATVAAHRVRFETVSGVIEAGVNYAAVATAGVKATGNFFFQHRYNSVRKTTFQFTGHANPNDTAAQNQKFTRAH